MERREKRFHLGRLANGEEPKHKSEVGQSALVDTKWARRGVGTSMLVGGGKSSVKKDYKKKRLMREGGSKAKAASCRLIAGKGNDHFAYGKGETNLSAEPRGGGAKEGVYATKPDLEEKLK